MDIRCVSPLLQGFALLMAALFGLRAIECFISFFPEDQRRAGNNVLATVMMMVLWTLLKELR